MKGTKNKGTKRYKVSVTEEDIREGEPEKSDFCPIALALGRLGFNASVYGTDITIRYTEYSDGAYTEEEASADLTRSAQRFIERFDNGRVTAKPFTFLLDVPLEAVPEVPELVK